MSQLSCLTAMASPYLLIIHNTRFFSWINLHFQTSLCFQGTLLQLIIKGKGKVVLCSV